MVLDASALTKYLESAIEEAVLNGLILIEDRARQLAPIRRVHKMGRRKERHVTAKDVASGSRFVAMSGTAFTAMNNDIGRRVAFGGGMNAKYGTAVFIPPKGRVPRVDTGAPRAHGRVNSLAPMIRTPGGHLSGTQFRLLDSGGGLRYQSVKVGNRSFKMDDLLTARGRYEVKTGRANELNASGQVQAGGRLRASIKHEGPYHDGNIVYGYVSAAAYDPGAKTLHNYAADMEYGSRHNKPHPFLRPALWESASRIKDLSHGVIAKALTAKSFVRNDESKQVAYRVKVDQRGFAQMVKNLNNLMQPDGQGVQRNVALLRGTSSTKTPAKV